MTEWATTAQIKALQERVKKEEERRTSADAGLATQLVTEEGKRAALEATINVRLAALEAKFHKPEEPKEEPKPPVEQPTGKVLFSSPGRLSDMNLGGSGSGKLVQGEGYIESHLEGTGSVTGERAEYAYKMPDLSSGTVLDEFEIYVVPGHMTWPTNGMHNLITQFKSNGTGSPAAALYLWGDTPASGRTSSGKGLWTSLSFAGAAGDGFRAPISEGTWHKIAIEYVGISNGKEGRINLAVDEVVVFAGGIGGPLIIPGQTSAYIKHGLYRNPGISGDGWIRQRNFRCTLLG